MRQPNAPPDSLSGLSYAVFRGGLAVDDEGARQTIAVIVTLRKSNKESHERPAGAYRSSRKRYTPYLITRL